MIDIPLPPSIPNRPDGRHMAGIPEDVWEAAEVAAIGAVAFSANPMDVVMPCIRAIMAERERCAQVADEAEIRSLATGKMAPIMGRSIIARAIRGKP